MKYLYVIMQQEYFDEEYRAPDVYAVYSDERAAEEKAKELDKSLQYKYWVDTSFLNYIEE